MPDNAVDHVARQVGIPPEELGLYDWAGRQSKRHRVEVRQHLGFRECSVADADKLTAWLAEHVAQAERRPERVREELLAHCRVERIEPPTVGRIDRMVASALHQAEEALSVRIAARLSTVATVRLQKLVAAAADDAGPEEEQEAEGPAPLALIKSDPGNVSLETMLAEIGKLEAVRAVGLPPGLFADVAPKVVAAWRARATVEAPSHLRTHPEPLRLTLLAALLHTRERELTDTLVDLLIATVHRINARAEKKITEELIREFKRVTGKETILFRIAEAAVEHPDDTVRAALFPVVPGGERTLRDLVAEYKASGPTWRRSVQTTLKASYASHYRKGLIRLLEVLAFRSSNTQHQPVIQALGLIGRHAHDGNTTYYPLGEHVPVHSGTVGDWEDLVWRDDRRGRRRVVRMAYEVATFQALRDRLRCKEIWVEGADWWRNPDQDLPQDFEARRAEHYQALRKPLDPGRFIHELQAEQRRELALLNDALPRLAWLDVADRPGGAIRLTPLEAAAEPRNLRRLKREVERRWGTVPLIDMLKEAALRTGCLGAVTAVAGRVDLDPQVLAERLLLCVYAYGTNTGLRAVAAGDHRHTEDDLRYVRRRFLSAEAARAMAVELANATFAARQQAIWGEGSTAVASDSTHVGAFDQNIFTQWHSRYGGRGVLIYWHVERRSMAVHSQLLDCTASEVAAMVEGAMHHGTSMAVEGNYVDSHGHVVTWTPLVPQIPLRTEFSQFASRVGLRLWRCRCGSASSVLRTGRSTSSSSMTTVNRSRSSRGSCGRWPPGTTRPTPSSPTHDLRYLWAFFAREGLTWQEFAAPHALILLEYLRLVPSRRPRQRMTLTVAVVDADGPGTKLAATTVNRILAAVSSFYEYAIMAGVFERLNPIEKRPDPALQRVPEQHRPFMGRASRQRPVRRAVRVKTVQRVPRPLSQAQTTALLGQLRSKRDRAIVLLMLQGGLRPGEVLGLRLEDIAYGRRRVVVRHRDDHPKGARSKSRYERVVDLHEPETLAAVSAYVMEERPADAGSPLVFLIGGRGKRRLEALGYDGLVRMFTRATTRAGIREPWVTPHACRHTHATAMWEGGMRELTLQKRLGHASPESTRIYTRVSDPAVVAEYNRALGQMGRDNAGETR